MNAAVWTLLAALAGVRGDFGHSGRTWSWKENFAVAPQGNPNIDAASISEVVLAPGGGYLPKEDPSAVDSTTLGLVGMYHLDNPPVDTGAEPDVSSANLTMAIVGSLVKAIPGKFDGALGFPGSTTPGASVAQIPADAWTAEQPLLGCAVSVWINIPEEDEGSASGGTIYERVYNGFQLAYDGRRKATSCTVRDGAGAFYTPGPYTLKAGDYGVWKHHVCTYDNTVGNITMFVDGEFVSSVESKSIATKGLNHGDHVMFGFGARPTAAGGGGGFTGGVDEVAIYERALTAAEIKSLASRKTALTPFPGVSYESNLIHTDVLEYWDATLHWATAAPVGEAPARGGGAAAPPITVEVSTNRGKSWCFLNNSQALTQSPAAAEIDGCHLPAKHFRYRVHFLSNVKLTDLSIDFALAPPARTFDFRLGSNMANVNYYMTAWMFKDLWRTASAPGGTGERFGGFDKNGYPLELNSTDPKVSMLIMRAMPDTHGLHHHPYGNFTIVFDGEGELDLGFECGNFRVPSSPFVLVCPKPRFDGAGISVSLVSSTRGNHLRNLRFISPDQAGGESYVADFETRPFTPPFLESIRRYKCIRFMDWSLTNGQNIAAWADRTTPSDFSQDRSHSRSVAVQSIIDVSRAGGDQTFSSTKWAAKVVTTTPHNFATGQTVTFAGTGASVTMQRTSKCSHGPFSFDSGLESAQINVLDATSFLVRYGVGYDPCFAETANLTSFTGASGGAVTLTVNGGAALELAAQLCATTDAADCWFNVPLLATDDYVMQMATLLKDHIPAGRKIYIEYSNEIWNYGFVQWSLSWQMAVLHGRKNSVNSNGAEQWWNVKRSLEIHKIFDGVFGGEARARLVRVLATQMNTAVTDGLEAALNDTTANPGLDGSGYDVLAVAPYFGEVSQRFDVRQVSAVFSLFWLL